MEEPVFNAHNKEEYAPSHTAEHILNQTMMRMFGCSRSRNAHIERKKSKISFELTECPSEDKVSEIAAKVNAIIAQDLPITYELATKDTIPAGVMLDKLPDDASETIRLVRVGDYDVCPCLGKHVEHTAQIGTFSILGTNWNEGSFRIRYKLLDSTWEQ